MTTIADRGFLSWLQGWSQILNLIGDLVTLKYEICILTPSLLNSYDQWIALVLLHIHRHCNDNNCWYRFSFVAPSLISDFESYWGFGDVEVRNLHIDSLTTQRLWSMNSPCLTPFPPPLQWQQLLIEVCFRGSKADLRFWILLGIWWCWSTKFAYWLPHYSTAMINGKPLSYSIATAIARPTDAERCSGLWLQIWLQILHLTANLVML